MTYEFEISNHWKIYFVISIQQLQFISSDMNFYERELYGNLSSIYVKEDSENEFYEIEKLINKRIIRKDREHFTQCLVRWKEYESKHDQGYSINSLNNIKSVIAKYENSFNTNAFNAII